LASTAWKTNSGCPITTSLDASYARVVAAGATPLMPPRTAPDGRTLFGFVGDPDGNLVELLQRTPSA
jgi:glyoxylase I family protein